MTVKLNILDVMSKDNVHQTIAKALSEGESSIVATIMELDDEELVADHCLVVEWLVNSDKLNGAQGVFIEAMEIAWACEITNEGDDTVISIGEVLAPDFHQRKDDDLVESVTVLIPDASYYGFSTESLKPTLNKLLSAMYATAKIKPLIRFTNNPRILDEKIKLSKDALLAVHYLLEKTFETDLERYVEEPFDLLKGTYDDIVDINASLVRLKTDLAKYKDVILPDNYYIDEALKHEIVMYSLAVNEQHEVDDNVQ